MVRTPTGFSIDVQPLFDRFQGNALVFIRNQPVQLRHRQVFCKGRVRQIHLRQLLPRLFYGGAGAEDAGDQFKLRDVLLSLHRRMIVGISHEIQPCDPKPLLVHRVIIQGVVLHHTGHADHGIVACDLTAAAQVESIVSRRDDHLISIRDLIV